ncbi:hypothetical protein G9U51_12260 [Calidifontibacter sp. DB0510]|uniref:DUF559 domain-containing protein n=1 Tax=Metallococcus carri TaxID=1656884 RepID=A0A967EHL5_9MICO|nr:hypothetical protein [Metallococcus carri]NHN56553.1 hypothetical protein [Metallococcus carri]NOP38852.1 hypothetical protein [Calidifontibacter sp. DB2511S]
MLALLEAQGGAASRAELRSVGLTRGMLVREVRQGRLAIDGAAVRAIGSPPGRLALMRRTLANAAPMATLDGMTALEFVGLEGFTDERVHVSIPKGARVHRRRPPVAVHELRWWSEDDVRLRDGLRYVAPPVAALRAALWADTVRAGETILAMAAQQHVVDPIDLAEAADRLPRLPRRTRVCFAVSEICGGAESIAELDLGAACRELGLPEPTRQRRLRRPSGTYYLDAEWRDYKVTLEVDGIQHLLPDRQQRDLLKHNEITLSGGTHLRATTSAVRDRDLRTFGQLREALRRNGWRG